MLFEKIDYNMKNKIIELLTEVRPEFDFKNSINFIEEGMLDSFDLVQLVDSLDSEFGISIDGTHIIPENFKSVESIKSLLIKNGVAK